MIIFSDHDSLSSSDEVFESSNKNECSEEIDSTALTDEALLILQQQLNGTGSFDTKTQQRCDQIMNEFVITSDDSSDSSSCESCCNDNKCSANASDSDEEILHFKQSGKRVRRIITDDENEMNSNDLIYEDNNRDLVDSEQDEEVVCSGKPRKRLRRNSDKDTGDCHISIEDDIDIKSGANALIAFHHSSVKESMYYGYNYRCTASLNHQSDDSFYPAFERDALHSEILELRSYLEENTDATDEKIVHTVGWLREMHARFCEK